jgi:hypothetical protein
MQKNTIVMPVFNDWPASLGNAILLRRSEDALLLLTVGKTIVAVRQQA